MKKLLALVLVMVLSLTVLVSCEMPKSIDDLKNKFNDLIGNHQHTFSEEWSSDENAHWHAATCDHTEEISDKADHTFVDGACSVCGYEAPVADHEHTFSADWSSDDAYHWHAATCEHTDEVSDKAAHTYADGVCSVCGSEEPVAHEHTFSEDWTYDDNYHWHAATCEHTDEVSDKAEHDLDDGFCTVCDFYTVEGDDTTSAVDEAAEYIRQLYKDIVNTSASYQLTNTVTIGDVTFAIAWTVSVDTITFEADAEDETLVNVIIPEMNIGDPAINYVLTATISDPDGNIAVQNFERVVPELKPATPEEYYAAKEGLIVVEGIVTGISSKSEGNKINALYVQDAENKGGYYVYSLVDKKDPVADFGVNLGMTVRVIGTKTIYNGTHEITDASLVILDSEVKEVKPVDYTEVFKSAESLSDKALVGLQGLLVTIKGVEIADQNLSNGYYNFTLGKFTSYVRISGSSTFLDATELEAFKSGHTANKGNTADATGIITIYNGSFYLVPVDGNAYSNYVMAERTDAEKVAFEKENLTVLDEVKSDMVITLPTTGSIYNDVLISWVSDNACAVVGADGTLTVTLPDEAVTVKLTATISYNGITETAEFNIAVAKKPTVVPSVVTDVKENVAYKLFYYHVGFANLPYYFNGTKGNYYGNTTDALDAAVDVYVENAEGGFYIYFLDAANNNTKTYIEAYMSGTYCNIKFNTETPASVFTMDAEYGLPVVVLNDVKYFLGTYGTNKDLRPSKYADYITSNTNCFAKFCEMVDVNAVPDDQKVADVKNTLALGQTEFTADGTLELPAALDNYADVAITWTANGEAVVGKLDIVIGDDAKEIKLVATITCGEVTDTKEFTVKVAGKTIDITSLSDANDKALAGSTDKVYVAGVVTSIKNTSYGNVYITDEFGFSFYIYGILDAEGNKKNFSSLGIEIGDYVVLNGALGTYNGSAQMVNASVIEHVAADTIVDANAAGAAVSGNNVLSEKEYLVTGTVTNIKDATKGYLYIKDADGNELYIYYLHDSTGELRFDALNPLPKVNDVITVKGYMTKYNSTVEMKDAKLLAISVYTMTDEDKANEEKDALNVPAKVDSNTTVVLPSVGSKYPEATITWTVNGVEVAEKYDIVLGNEVETFVFVATIKLGEATVTAEFATVTVLPAKLPAAADIETSTGSDKPTSYFGRETANGWTAENAQLISSSINSEFAVIGDEYGWVINGKTSALGSIKSPKLMGTLGTIKFNYGFPFGDSQFQITVSVVDENGNVFVSQTYKQTGLAKLDTGVFEWNLTADEMAKITGPFYVVIHNDSLTGTDKNRDRLAIWNIELTEGATHEHSYDHGCDADCNECGEVRDVAHKDENSDKVCDNCNKEIDYAGDTPYAPETAEDEVA